MNQIDADMLARAEGCMLGQLCGDALGSLVEFQTEKEIRSRYPEGVKELIDGGTWNTIAGQPTDDSEMALMLAQTLVSEGTYRQDDAREAYEYWLSTVPFDMGMTVFSGLNHTPNHNSEANGALMRISPLGIFAVRHPPDLVEEWARQDSIITHPNLVCRHINVLFVKAIALAIRLRPEPREIYASMLEWARAIPAMPSVLEVLKAAADAPPKSYSWQEGWVLIAFQNAVWQLLHADSFEAAVIDTVMRGGDTDTNAAICGALLGALYGRAAVPIQWQTAVLNCRPKAGAPGVLRPRPESLWPVDALELARALLFGK
jgi:ADP-ribosylglycohydrolase